MSHTTIATKSLSDTSAALYLDTWPATSQTSQCNSQVTLQDLGSRALSNLLCSSWHCALNPEFNCLSLNLRSGQRKSLNCWVKKFGMLGHVHCLRVTLGTHQVLLYRPVCTYFDKDFICFHYLNRVPRLVHLEG